jgi:hypothetical protein
MKMKTFFFAWLIFCGSFFGLSHVSGTPLPSQKPASVEIPQKRLKDLDERYGRDENGVGIAIPQKAGHTSDDDKDAALPPVPNRAPPPSLRNPKITKQALGPPAPPENWNQRLIADANRECAQLVSAKDYEFDALEPFKEGVCGAPAPIILKGLNLVPNIRIEPAPTITCPLADAVRRWLVEIVQPRAKVLLQDDIVGLTNVASYHCRTRYNDPTRRMSHHAFANALDISEFLMAKGDHISLTEHWDAGDSRSQFLKEIHSGACKIFGTVLGPEANAAHKSHFHLDMAKRRFSSFCQ